MSKIIDYEKLKDYVAGYEEGLKNYFPTRKLYIGAYNDNPSKYTLFVKSRNLNQDEQKEHMFYDLIGGMQICDSDLQFVIKFESFLSDWKNSAQNNPVIKAVISNICFSDTLSIENITYLYNMLKMSKLKDIQEICKKADNTETV